MQKYLKIHASAENLKAELLRFEQWPDWWPGVERVDIVERGEDRSVLDLAINLRKRFTMTVEFDTTRRESIRFHQRRGWFKSYGGCWDLLPPQDDSGATILKITVELAPPILVPKSMVYQNLAKSLGVLEQRLNQRLYKPEQPETVPAEEISAVDDAGKAGTKVYVFPSRKGIEVWIRGRCFHLKHTGLSGRGFDLSSLTGKDTP